MLVLSGGLSMSGFLTYSYLMMKEPTATTCALGQPPVACNTPLIMYTGVRP